MGEEKPIRVMIVDDHAVVRSGLAAFLTVFDDLQLVGEAGSGVEALQLCEQAAVDVVLMDLMMPEMDGAEATPKMPTRSGNYPDQFPRRNASARCAPSRG